MSLPGLLWCSVSDTKYVPSGLFMMFTCLILRMSLPGRLWCSVPDTKNVPFGLSMMFMSDTKIYLPGCLWCSRAWYSEFSSGLLMVLTYLILRMYPPVCLWCSHSWYWESPLIPNFIWQSRTWHSECPLRFFCFHFPDTQNLFPF